MTDDLREVYDRIAPEWYNFRHHTRFRRELESLATEWRGGRLLNIGCGHGADFPSFAGKFELHGADFSREMLKLGVRYTEKYGFNTNLIQADAAALPYASGIFDHAIAIATYHHLKQEQRLPAMLELKRVLKPGGEAFITVWNRWQPRFWFRRSDIIVPWRTGQTTLYRYYHLFTHGELVRLAKHAGFDVVKAFPESSRRFLVRRCSRNVCLAVQKTPIDA